MRDNIKLNKDKECIEGDLTQKKLNIFQKESAISHHHFTIIALQSEKDDTKSNVQQMKINTSNAMMDIL